MDDLSFGVLCALVFGCLVGILAGGNMTDLHWRNSAVEHGYGQWCADRSFAWQHEECE